MTETARALLTPDECMRLPGAVKDDSGKIVSPGDMLVFVAGSAPIYGRQILYFLDPTFSARSKILAPATSDRIDAGTTPARAVAPETAEDSGKTRFAQVLHELERRGD